MTDRILRAGILVEPRLQLALEDALRVLVDFPKVLLELAGLLQLPIDVWAVRPQARAVPLTDSARLLPFPDGYVWLKCSSHRCGVWNKWKLIAESAASRPMPQAGSIDKREAKATKDQISLW